jgi:energy-coupling factor transporter ATP-binding protein EcfA2
MNALPLIKLTIEHLRGSVLPFSLPFEKGKKLSVIYGENGTGKSTICDALEFIGKGRVGSLENRGLGKTQRFWHSLGKKPSDVSVRLETASDTGGSVSCRATMVKTDVTVVPEALRPKIEVLRRKQIVELIEAKPGDRYAAISRFIDVSAIEASEATLRQLVAELNKDRELAVARVQENLDTLMQFWEAAGKLGKDYLTWADEEAKRDPETAAGELAAIDSLQKAYQRLADYPPQLKQSADTIKRLTESRDEAAAKLEACAKTISDDAGESMGILEAASGYFHKHPAPAACPLCESAENAAQLPQKTKQRLETFSSLQAAVRSKEQADTALSRASAQLESLNANFRRHADEFERVRSGFSWSKDVVLPSSTVPQDHSLLEEWLKNSSDLPIAWKRIEVARQDRRQFLTTLKTATKTFKDNRKAQKELDALLPKLQQALEVVEDERRKFTDEILSKIAQEVGRIYELVHPGEGMNKISLELDPNRRASLEIGAVFCGQAGAPPQAYFSDSHLDTLGLCVFLALAALDGPEQTILALDDVLASVDEPHVERLIEMLYAEAVKFRHCVITTHYRPWKEKLRWGWLKNGQCQFIELTKWTNTEGLALTRSVPDAERLRLLLNESPPDPQLVCAKAGVILEAVLNFLTQLYECSCPRRAGGLYTLGDLLPSIEKKLRQALEVHVLVKDAAGTISYQTTKLAPILEELMRIAQARNVFGCHFNELSFALLDADAINFGQNVLVLIETVADPEAGWPRNDKSGKYWANSGETRRLIPLQQPK